MIRVNELTKTFSGKKAVNNLSFEVAPGRVTGFVGPNGAGKSTTMQMMVGLTRPSSGSVTWAGETYSDMRTPGRVVGVMLDTRVAHPKRTARNHLRSIAVLTGVSVARVDEVLEQVGLTSAAKQRTGTFSLGMRQRLALATALLGDPEVLMLDEPFNGLDPDGIRWLRSFLRTLGQNGRTVFVSSHLISELAQFAEDIVVIGDGQLIAAGPVAELTAREQSEVLAETPAVEALEALALAQHWKSERTPEGLRLFNTTRAQVADLAMAHQIPIHGLTESTVSLEDVLLDLTAASAQYSSGPS